MTRLLEVKDLTKSFPIRSGGGEERPVTILVTRFEALPP